MADGPIFTVLLPVHRPPDLLRFAIKSVLAQSLKQFELFIVCDGAPEETVEAAKNAAAKDPRIEVFPFEKGERNGETHRHEVLKQAKGMYVCQIADDDLWLSNHLDEMQQLLEVVDFGNVMFNMVAPDGSVKTLDGDLGDPDVREKMLTSRFNVFGPTASGYRLSTYRDLAAGWTPAPSEIWSDLFMWRKFLAHPGIRCGTRRAVTMVHFAAVAREDMPLTERRAEIERWSTLLDDPIVRGLYTNFVLASAKAPSKLLSAETSPDSAMRLAKESDAMQANIAALEDDRQNLTAAIERLYKSYVPGPLHGSVDEISATGCILGWARDESHVLIPVEVEAVIGSKAIACASACLFRQDLMEVGIGNGFYAFKLETKLSLQALKGLKVRRKTDGVELKQSDYVVEQLRALA